MAEEKKEKIDEVLEEIRGLKAGQQSLEEGQRSLKEGQQKNYELIQKNGIELEKLGTDIKAVAEGHGVIRSEMKQMKVELLEKFEENKAEIRWVAKDLKEVKEKVGKIDRTLDEHVKLPAHV